MSNDKPDNAGVITFPPVLYFSGFLIGLLIHYLYPIRLFPESLTKAVGVLLALASFPVALSAVLVLRRARTTFDVRKPTTAIVSSGIFRFSRNPMYVCLTLLYLGVALWINNVWTILILAPVLIIMHQGIIKREEMYLERKFGEGYLRYKSRVRRWI